ncbi:MAG: hypothetical protein P3A28_05590 [Gemmatimonadota bacterium]|nr:hypothetical protein [Gemmatimonadota bacterium]
MFLRSHAAAAAVIGAALCAAADPAGGQDVDAGRQGLTSSFGVAASTAGVSCVPDCSASRTSGPSFLIRGGAHLASQFAIVAEANLFRQDITTPTGPGSWALSWYTLGMLLYPRPEEDVFLSIGVGMAVARMHVTFPDVGALKMNASNLGSTVGIGRDFRFRDSMAVTAYAQYLFSGRTQALIGRSNSGAKVSTDVLTAGLALTLF